VSDSVGFVWDDRLSDYDFGRGHPLAPIRVQLAKRLSEEFGLLDLPNVTLLGDVEPLDDDDLLAIHDLDYVTAVRAASDNTTMTNARFGLGTEDVPTFLGMHEAASRVCSATLIAAREVHCVPHSSPLGAWLRAACSTQ
jgi:acetoin utilization protein AcuC